MNSSVTVILDNLSVLIIAQLKGVAQQQYFPVSDPDDMDTCIQEGKKRADQLRKLREEFENIVTGVL